MGLGVCAQIILSGPFGREYVIKDITASCPNIYRPITTLSPECFVTLNLDPLSQFWYWGPMRFRWENIYRLGKLYDYSRPLNYTNVCIFK